ncbi:ComEC/Rec2 family competence protein [Novosphingobium sp.]|uniref:ComEC/Rec2 family competence protein n=1 Tax=Novosphingobium sp. TaxID=1874826 RepID=UPI001DD7CDCF|nr:ComEC/Rec2 family competence protein [Novosphingobium sp.]MBX9665067.1 competence protein ComEC family protein [Novosphingobium sp.]
MHRTIEAFLGSRPFERGPWLAVAFGVGIACWAVLAGPWQWAGFLALCGAVAVGGLLIDSDGDLGHLRAALIGMSAMLAAGCAVIWTKSVVVGEPGIARPEVVMIEGRVLDRQVEGARDRVRLLIRAQVEGHGEPLQVRLNLPDENDQPGLVEGAQVRLRARLMPPAPPMLPGAYDFARAAWFQGLAATGNVVGPVTLVAPAQEGWSLRQWQQRLADHVRAQLSGSPGTIAAAFASGDRGAIAQDDEEAMRDAGLTHLLSISGLHVSAVIAGAYFLTIRLLALFPFIALRVRLPLLAAGVGAGVGLFYTLLTGAEVPTVRSVAGSLLVLAALALGRDPLSLRLLATAAVIVMLLWPEAVLGPSFQMSFASVIAIVAFSTSAPAKAFLSHSHEGSLARLGRHLAMLLMTGLVIEIALMPISLFHFHRAGIYGAAANVIAIPLTTVLTMPLIALALALDLFGLGAPAWWAVGKSLELLLWLAHLVAGQPGAVTMMPGMTGGTFALFVSGLLWLALWSGRVRLWGFAPIALGVAALMLTRTPDVLISGDGHHVGITGEGPDLLVLRAVREESYTRTALLENAGMTGDAVVLEDWKGARCNPDFCAISLVRGGRRFDLLMARGKDLVAIPVLAAACQRADIVVADRRLPAACKPRLLKADRALLRQTGGLAIDLVSGRVRSVAETQGEHGWFRRPPPWQPRARQAGPASTASGEPGPKPVQ